MKFYSELPALLQRGIGAHTYEIGAVAVVEILGDVVGGRGVAALLADVVTERSG